MEASRRSKLTLIIFYLSISYLLVVSIFSYKNFSLSWPLLVLSMILILTLGWNLYKANLPSYADTGETVVAIAVDDTDKARALREINFLTKASELFNSSLDIDEVLNSIAKMTAGIIGDRCGIYLEVEGKDTLWPVALYSRLNESVEEIWNFILIAHATSWHHVA